MHKNSRAKNGKWRIIVYFYLVLILLILLTVASYTWFSISRTPRVSDLYMTVNTTNGLELSTDPLAEEWVLQLDYRDVVSETSPLRPITWSQSRGQFIAAMYGIDGRLTDYSYWIPLTDEQNANRDDVYGYYTKTTFYARSGQNVQVSLSPAVEVEEGTGVQGSGTYVIGTPVWNSEAILHDNGGQGAECAVRVGIRITPTTETGTPNGTSEFFIYEPNANTHIDGSTGYTETESIDGTPSLIDAGHHIIQSASAWAEAYPVQRDVVVRDLGEFTTPTKLFNLLGGEMVQIDLYIWLEGQDVDCTNQLTAAQIIASIQFAAQTDTQSGMVPIQ